jgi:putative N6-adenine-specific DNA methylase
MILNLHLRTAQRVLYLLDTMPVSSPGALYARINALGWEEMLHESGKAAYLCVTSVVDNPSITDSRFLNMKVKDAIVDRIRDKCGLRPDSGPEKDRAVVHVYWKNDRAEVYLDTSGERLARRGYRSIPLDAPMQETLAAAVIFATDWKPEEPFINPMCGSGTLAIEAALIALGRAPGLLRNNYGFMYVKGYDDALWQSVRKKAKDASSKKLPGKIIATDISKEAVTAARQNAQNAGVDHLIEFATCSFENTPIPEISGVIVINPPYGARMGDVKRLESTYQGMGDFFKKTGGGYCGYIFTGNLDLAKKIGLRTKRRIILYNGEIECRLLEYELYAGSRKK